MNKTKCLGIKKLNLFLFFLAIFELVLSTEKPPEFPGDYRCEVNEKHPPIAFQAVPNNEQTKRNLNEDLPKDSFKEINIYLELTDLRNKANQTKEGNLNCIIEGMEKAVATLKSLINVTSLTKEYNFSDKNLITYLTGIEDFNETVIGPNCKSMNDLHADLIIIASFKSGMDNVVAKPQILFIEAKEKGKVGRPILGSIIINSDIDYQNQYSKNHLNVIFLHEFTHILGFTNYYFEKLDFIETQTIDNVTHRYLKSETVSAFAKNYFNCGNITGVELEENNSSHWKARYLLGEYMNSFFYKPELVISEFTLAALEDLGFYKVNYYTGGLMQFGKNKGCEFLNQKCVINGEVNKAFKNEFFDKIREDGDFPFDPRCSSGRQSKTIISFGYYSTIPEKYQYFPSPTVSGYFPSVDYCPVATDLLYNATNVGSCNERNNAFFDALIGLKWNKKKGDDYALIFNENYTDHSFCVLSSLVKNSVPNYRNYEKELRPLCYEMFCSNESLTIKINEDYIVCPKEGGKIKVDGFGGYLLCPDYYLICSGTVLCNNLFDCVEKKSLTKEDSYKINYRSETTQDLNDANKLETKMNNYELGIGKCPQNCANCGLDFECKNCKRDFGLVVDKVSVEVSCKLISKIKKETICGDNCIECKNKDSCTMCNINYTLFKGKCIESITDCDQLNDKGSCIKCKKGFELSEKRTCQKCGKGEYSKKWDKMSKM